MATRKITKRARRRQSLDGRNFAVNVESVFRFTNDRPVPIEDVIQSLQGLDKMVTSYVPMAVKRLTGAHIVTAQALVEGFEDGSLIEKILTTLIFKDEASMEAFLQKIRQDTIERFKGAPPIVKGAIITSVVAVVALGAYAYLAKDDGEQSGALINIKGDNNIALVIGAEAYNTSPDEFEKAVNGALDERKKRALSKAASDFIAPARAEIGAGLSIEDRGEYKQVVSPGTVQKTPVSKENIDESFDVYEEHVTVQLRATDVDSNTRGWAGTIVSKVPNRTRIVFSRESDMLKVIHRSTFDANVSITYASEESGRPILITVEHVL